MQELSRSSIDEEDKIPDPDTNARQTRITHTLRRRSLAIKYCGCDCDLERVYLDFSRISMHYNMDRLISRDNMNPESLPKCNHAVASQSFIA